jgi:hypothetical protein
MLMLDGTATSLPGRLDELNDREVETFLSRFREGNEGGRDFEFEIDYFRERFRLASNNKATYVATWLRRLLAAGTSARESPRRRGLAMWARASFQQDMRKALETGLPRKTLLFTAWVGQRTAGEAAALKALLAEAFAHALASEKKRLGPTWSVWEESGCRRLEEKAAAASAKVGGALRALRDDELTCALAGKHQFFASRLSKELEKRAGAIEEARVQLSMTGDGHSFEARALRRRIKDMEAGLSPWTTGPALRAVERYTGGESRSTRDRAATAFREVGPPWVLVASHVGSEGIDLHTYTARIIHYDLEWNPARMEQREGRGDRVGRRLQEELVILYCLVPRTYDERMFYQLVARDRWHGVLLGKPANQLDDVETNAPLIDRKRIARMRLDLAPRKV